MILTRPLRYWRPAFVTAVVALLLIGGTRTAAAETTDAEVRTFANTCDTASYAAVLESCVDGKGLVNYGALKALEKGVGPFLRSCKKVSLEEFEKWPDKERFAFWANFYNAFTLWIVNGSYPIKPELAVSLDIPDNSIRQIRGARTAIPHALFAGRVTIEVIEQEYLAPAALVEPRLRFAVVFGAKGFAPLRREPYDPARLDEQLDDQVKRVLGDPERFSIDREHSCVRLPRFLEWHGSDFEPCFGTDEAFAGRSDTERAVLNFICRYVGDADRDYLRNGQYEIEYVPFDWTLNEQVPPPDAASSGTPVP